MRRWSSERERAGATQGESGPVSRQRPENARALIRAPSRLPDDVLEFAIDKCAFFSLGGAGNGQCLPSRFIEGAEWLLLIYDDAPDIETVIAHEVAHAYLGHSITDPADAARRDGEAGA